MSRHPSRQYLGAPILHRLDETLGRSHNVPADACASAPPERFWRVCRESSLQGHWQGTRSESNPARGDIPAHALRAVRAIDALV